MKKRSKASICKISLMIAVLFSLALVNCSRPPELPKLGEENVHTVSLNCKEGEKEKVGTVSLTKMNISEFGYKFDCEKGELVGLVFSSEEKEAFFSIGESPESEESPEELSSSDERRKLVYRKSFTIFPYSLEKLEADMPSVSEQVSFGSNISVIGKDIEYVIKINDLSVTSSGDRSYNINIKYSFSKYRVIKIQAEAGKR